MASETARVLHGTAPLTMEGDLAAQMVEALDGYVTDAVARSPEKREILWSRDYSSHEAYTKSVEPNRERFKKQIGCLDERLPIEALNYVATTSTAAQVVESDDYTVSRVRWQVFDGVEGEGLLLEPRDDAWTTQVVAIPDADWTPEMIAGVTNDLPLAAQYAKRFVRAGCRVVVPLLINRDDTYSGNPTLEAMTNQPHREFIYRMAYQLGRHIIGYEVQKVLSLVDWMSHADGPIGVIGYGEGGLIALYSAAADTRIQATAVSGYFQSRQGVWREPIYRNVWGLLHEFGDADIASLIAPRPLIIEVSRGPEVAGPPPPRSGRGGGAPGQLVSPPLNSVKTEFDRARDFYQQLGAESAVHFISPEDGLPGAAETVRTLLTELGAEDPFIDSTLLHALPPRDYHFDDEARQKRQFMQLVNLSQRFLREAASRRQQFFWKKTDTTSLESWEATCREPKTYFWDEVIGRCPAPDVPANPRTRLIYDEPNWKGYEVVLDVWKDVFAYGILLLPNDLQPGEQRPVVVCQHGLEGRPQDTADPRIESVYYSYAASLADRGFITYAPQNPYIGQDAFRVLQRKGNPIKWSLFSLIIRQHERTLDWLAEQPFVDADRIGFYGLSYGGKTAMRVPAVLDRYACSICSADFNEWIVKNATFDSRYSYVFTGEYEMPEFDLGNTFNYGEMAGLIAPRPFMVERGHEDGVAPDEWVAHEFAVVRRLYVQLGIADRTEIEFFDGGHQINAEATFRFLHRHLNWPEPTVA